MNSHKALAVGATWAVFTWPSQTAVSNKSVQTEEPSPFPVSHLEPGVLVSVVLGPLVRWGVFQGRICEIRG